MGGVGMWRQLTIRTDSGASAASEKPEGSSGHIAQGRAGRNYGSPSRKIIETQSAPLTPLNICIQECDTKTNPQQTLVKIFTMRQLSRAFAKHVVFERRDGA